MKFILAAGGTGGHVYPAIAIAQELKKEYPDSDILFLGREDSIEGRIVPAAGFDLANIDVSGFERFYSFKRKIKVGVNLLKSFGECRRIFKDYNPDMVIGAGGYVCGPVLMTAYLKHIPSVVCEQNVIPGFTTKTLSGFSNNVCVSFEESIPLMKKPERCVWTGNPVRDEFATLDKESARKSVGIPMDKKVIFIFGGSLGARKINVASIGLIRRFNNDDNIEIYLITGKDMFDQIKDSIDFNLGNNVHVLDYCDNMPEMLNASDLVISRSGASTIAEINYVGLPAVYVPFPHAVNDHQTKNAKVCVDNNAALMVTDDNMNEDVLFDIVNKLIFDDEVLASMKKNSLDMGKRDAAVEVCRVVSNLLK